MAGTARSCFAGPSWCPTSRLTVLRCRSSRRIDCSAAAECGPVPGSQQPAPLVERLAATVQRAAAAFMEQRAAASLQLQRWGWRRLATPPPVPAPPRSFCCPIVPACVLAQWKLPSTILLHSRLTGVSSSSSSSGGSSACQRLGSLALLAAAAAGPLPGASILADLRSNYVFCVGFCGWFLAQFLKIFTKVGAAPGSGVNSARFCCCLQWLASAPGTRTLLCVPQALSRTLQHALFLLPMQAYKTGVWDVRAFFDSGGMPSSHSSLCSSVATAVAMQQGLGSPMFAVCVCFRCAGALAGRTMLCLPLYAAALRRLSTPLRCILGTHHRPAPISASPPTPPPPPTPRSLQRHRDVRRHGGAAARGAAGRGAQHRGRECAGGAPQGGAEAQGGAGAHAAPGGRRRCLPLSGQAAACLGARCEVPQARREPA